MSGKNDPLNFLRAEDYFEAAKEWGGPKKVTSISLDPPSKGSPYRVNNYHGVTLTFDDNTLCVVQFIRPTVFRVRYDPSITVADDYGDENR
jgi:hypothetical protein